MLVPVPAFINLAFAVPNIHLRLHWVDMRGFLSGHALSRKISKTSGVTETFDLHTMYSLHYYISNQSGIAETK